jgi:hypothetical protein
MRWSGLYLQQEQQAGLRNQQYEQNLRRYSMDRQGPKNLAMHWMK